MSKKDLHINKYFSDNGLIRTSIPILKYLFSDLKFKYSSLILTIILTTISSTSNSQDIHFSQFNQSPLNLNPALTGMFEGDFRFVGNHRNQWSSITVPYVTFSASADMRYTKFNLKKSFVGFGLIFNTDKAGDGNFGTNQIILSAAYHRAVNADSTIIISAGANFGFIQHSVDYNAFYFGNQYTGYQFDSSLPNNEYFSKDNFNYVDFSMGFSSKFLFDNSSKLTLGVSFMHLTSPQKSFYSDADSELHNKFNIHSTYDIPFKEKHSIIPSIVYYRQGKLQELYIGGEFRYGLKDLSFRNLYFGLWTRTSDAAIIKVGMDYKDFNFGFSYDINYSKLRTVSGGQGGYEISIIYIISKQNDELVPQKYQCPDFM